MDDRGQAFEGARRRPLLLRNREPGIPSDEHAGEALSNLSPLAASPVLDNRRAHRPPSPFMLKRVGGDRVPQRADRRSGESVFVDGLTQWSMRRPVCFAGFKRRPWIS